MPERLLIDKRKRQVLLRCNAKNDTRIRVKPGAGLLT